MLNFAILSSAALNCAGFVCNFAMLFQSWLFHAYLDKSPLNSALFGYNHA